MPKDSDFDLICCKLVSCYPTNVLTDSYAILPLGHACFASLKAIKGLKSEEYYDITFVARYFLKKRSRKTNKRAKNCKIETIGQELENRKTKIVNRNNHRVETELWVTTPIILFPDSALIAPLQMG